MGFLPSGLPLKKALSAPGIATGSHVGLTTACEIVPPTRLYFRPFQLNPLHDPGLHFLWDITSESIKCFVVVVVGVEGLVTEVF